MSSEYIKKIRTEDGDKQIDYESLANLPDLSNVVNEALEQAKASGQFDGQDGNDGVGIKSIAKTSSSGLVDVYTITMTDNTKYTFTITNGRDGSGGTGGGTGADGFSPVANVTETDTGAMITITDQNGTTVATINHGQKGDKGDTPVRGTDYWTASDIAEIKSYVDEAILGGEW